MAKAPPLDPVEALKRFPAEAWTQEDIDAFRLRAQAEIELRKQQGTWDGGVRAHEEYQTRPLDWMVDKLGMPRERIQWSLNPEYANHDWDGDPDPLATILNSLAAGKDVGVESATGVGKTALGALIVLWFLACFRNSIIATAAPKEDQLLLHIWKEIGNYMAPFKKHFPNAVLLTGKIRMVPAADDGKEKWAASAFVCGVGANEESATKAQGLHGEHLLIITEETPGIHPAIMNAFYNTRTDDHNLHLAFGNPDHQHDPLHEFCMLDEVVAVRVSALDHPNIVTGRRVVPGAIGKRRLEERTNKLGKGSRLFNSRVRGISPSEAEDSLIKWAWCEAAAERYNDERFRQGGEALGVDVAASENGDKGAIARWKGACLTEVEDFKCPDPNALGTRVAMEAQSKGIKGKNVGVDSVGVGAGTVNECKRLGLRVRSISGASRAVPYVDADLRWSETEADKEGTLKARGPVVVEAERFANERAQVWWRMREDLRLGHIALPKDEELFRDLTTPTYHTTGGKIVVEPKEDILKRLKRSPNKGDAACYGNHVRERGPLTLRESIKEAEPTDMRDTGLERLFANAAKQQAARVRTLGMSARRFGRRR